MRIRKHAAPEAATIGKKSVGREILEWAVTLGLAVVLALSVHTWVGELVTIDGPSMQPNLWKDEKVLVGRVEYYFAEPKRGDIVLVRFPGSDLNYIKRVIATGGEQLAISNGIVFIGGKQLDEPYTAEPAWEDMDEITVPEGSIYVMGDNRNDSHDSRSPDVGPIPLDQVKGRAYALVWPVDKYAKLTVYTGTLEQ
jgi:signal peptidase I